MATIPSLVKSESEEPLPKENIAPPEEAPDSKIYCINFEVIEDYHSVMRNEDWINLFNQKRFNFSKDKLLLDRIRKSVYLGLHKFPVETREKAWLLMLGINPESEEFRTY